MRRTLVLFVALLAAPSWAAEPPLLSAKETQEAEALIPVMRETVSKFDVLRGLAPTTKRAEAARQTEAKAAARLKMMTAELDKSVADVKAKFAMQKFEKTPPLILVGDIHDNKEDGKIIAAIIDRTTTDHFVALEGLSIGWKTGPVEIDMVHGRKLRIPADARVTGIESPDNVAMDAPFQMVKALDGTEKERASARKMLLQMLVMGYGDNLLEVLARDVKLSTSMARLVDFLKKNDLATVTLALEKAGKDLPADKEWKALAYVIWARNCRYFFAKSPLADEVKRVADAIIANPSSSTTAMVLWHLVSFEIRNVRWAAFVSGIYQKTSATEEPLYVVMGVAHVPTMQKYLTEVLGPHGVKVTTQYRKHHLEALREDKMAHEKNIQETLATFPE